MTGEGREPRPSGGPGSTSALALRGVRKRYGEFVAVDGIDLEVRRGEFVTLLGPSGSGKTTTLRMIAGFVRQDAGTIEIDGTDMARVPPYRRDVGMVFQNYALFPHMSVAENLAFPLDVRRLGRAEKEAKVARALGMVQMGAFANRRDFPEAWRGLSGAELCEQTGVADAIFCHTAGFYASAQSCEGVLELAHRALENRDA